MYPPESVPTRKSLFLLAFDVPEGIADVLKIKVHSTLLQACPLTAPVPEKVTVRALTRLVTVRAGELFLRFLLLSLRANRASEQANAETQGKQEPTLSTAQARHLPPPMMIDLAFRLRSCSELLRRTHSATNQARSPHVLRLWPLILPLRLHIPACRHACG